MKQELNSKRNNERGFTLVELLAVIVVLAIVMLIGVQAVLPQMASARKQAFALEVNEVISAAQNYIVTEAITNNLVVPAGGTCVTVQDLIDKGYYQTKKDGYAGYINIAQVALADGQLAVQYTYTVTMTNGQYYVSSAGGDDAVVATEVKEGNKVGTTAIASACPSSTPTTPSGS